MPLLLLFALLAGAGTAITPCVLPVLPALLSASATGGRRRPIGIVLGLAITFTIAIVALAQLVKGVGLASGATRTIAIVFLFTFGVVMFIPELSARLEAPLSRLARFGPRTRGTGFCWKAEVMRRLAAQNSQSRGQPREVCMVQKRSSERTAGTSSGMDSM